MAFFPAHVKELGIQSLNVRVSAAIRSQAIGKIRQFVICFKLGEETGMLSADVGTNCPLSDGLIAWVSLAAPKRSPYAHARKTSEGIGNLAGIATKPVAGKKVYQIG